MADVKYSLKISELHIFNEYNNVVSKHGNRNEIVHKLFSDKVDKFIESS